MVQAALNKTPADRLDGATPLTAFTALSGGLQLASILHPRDPLEASLAWVDNDIQEHLADVRQALDAMHLEMTDASEKRRRAARARVAKKKASHFRHFVKVTLFWPRRPQARPARSGGRVARPKARRRRAQRLYV